MSSFNSHGNLMQLLFWLSSLEAEPKTGIQVPWINRGEWSSGTGAGQGCGLRSSLALAGSKEGSRVYTQLQSCPTWVQEGQSDDAMLSSVGGYQGCPLAEGEALSHGCQPSWHLGQG